MMSIKKQRGLSTTTSVLILLFVILLGAVLKPWESWQAQSTPNTFLKDLAQSFEGGLSLIHSQWQAQGKPQFIAFDSVDGAGYLQMSTKGWPYGISSDGRTLLYDIDASQGFGSDACTQVIMRTVNTAGAKIIAADEIGKCARGDICVEALGNGICEFRSQSSTERFQYNALTGVISLQ